MIATDLAVVLPGLMGSTLRHRDKLVWAPSAGSALAAVKTFGKSIKALKLPDDIGDAHPEDGVEPVALMPDLHVLPGIWTPVKGYDRLLGRLRELGYRETDTRPGAPPGNLLPVAYDWRLSNRYLGSWLASIVEPALDRWRAQGDPYADAKLVLICHSMGGLVARWYIEHGGGAELTRKLITIGTPYRGAAKALDQLVNGVHPGLGPLAIDLTDFARSLPSMHQLLPEYACIDIGAGDLARTTETTIPELCARRIADAMLFHAQIGEAERLRAASLTAAHAIVGINQPTPTTVQITGGRAHTKLDYRNEHLHGDSTVPIVGACRADVSMDSNTLRRVPDKHGNLQRNRAALDEIEGILTAKPVKVRAPGTIELRVSAPELVLAGDPIPVSVRVLEDRRIALRLSVLDEAGKAVHVRVVKPQRGTATATITDLAPGAYTIDTTAHDLMIPVAPVRSDILVWA